MISGPKALMIAVTLSTAISVSAQLPGVSPRRAASHARSAAREARDVTETVNDVNDAVNAISDARKTIDSLVANDKSKTKGKVHFLFMGVSMEDASLSTVEEALKKIEDVSEVSKVAKTGSIAIQMNTELNPYDIWKKMPKSVQRSFFVHDKDQLNIVLLNKIPPPKPKK
jgi:hypothetical protein